MIKEDEDKFGSKHFDLLQVHNSILKKKKKKQRHHLRNKKLEEENSIEIIKNKK